MWRTLLEKDLMRDEGFSQFPYMCPAGHQTIGYGRNLEHRGLSTDEAMMLLRNDLSLAERELKAAFPWYPSLPGQVKRGLINMHVNLGLPRLMKFKNMLKALSNGDYALAADEALDSKWARQVGERARRIAEMMQEAD